MSTITEVDVMDDELLDLTQTAKLLGISEKSLLRLLSQEEIPARKIVGKWRFSKQAVIKWISEGKSTHYAKNANVEEDVEDADTD